MQHKTSVNKIILITIILVALVAGIAYILKPKQETTKTNLSTPEQKSAPLTTEDSQELEALLKELKNTETESEINIDNIE